MQMESQISTPTIWFQPTSFNPQHHFQQLVHVDDVTKHRFLQHQYIPTASQPVLLPAPHGTHGHFVVQQIVHQPFLSNHATEVSCGATATAPTITPAASASAAGPEHLFTAAAGSEAAAAAGNLMFGRAAFHQTAPTPLLISQHGFNAKISQQQTLEINLNDVLTHKTIASKSQRKKKVSPSAKRRSRKRLMAFLEAKRKKDCPTITEQAEPTPIATTTTTTAAEDKQHLLLLSSTSPTMENGAVNGGDHQHKSLMCDINIDNSSLSASSPAITSSSHSSVVMVQETDDKDAGGLL